MAPLAAHDTRLGQLQRGRGAGFLAALQNGGAQDELLHCLLCDPRVDAEVESRARYYAELMVATGLALAPIVASVRPDDDCALARATIAGAWTLGHQPTRAWLMADDTEDRWIEAIAAELWSQGWATPIELPPRAAAAWRRCDIEAADSAVAAEREVPATALAGRTVAELLELARGPNGERRDRLLGELCARGDEATRAQLRSVVHHDLVYERVRLAARALGTLGDEHAVPLAEALFARDDVFEDPARRLAGADRMRRACLADYLRHLPGPQALALARAWRDRGGYFDVVVGGVFREHATAADREALESWVASHADDDGGTNIIDELDALARLGDPRSAPLLVEIANTTDYSHARRRAVHALAMLADLPTAAAVLREALWDAEDEAAADGCAFLPRFDREARQRLETLTGLRLAASELRLRATRRLQREHGRDGSS